jgi:hypothetical protein
MVLISILCDIFQVYGVHGVITGGLPAQCDFNFGTLLREKHTFLALSISKKLIDSSLLQLKKCYYFTFMPQAVFPRIRVNFSVWL